MGDKPYNDLKDLAVLCKDLGLEEHIKVFPLGHNKALMSSPKANKYVHEMNQHPELSPSTCCHPKGTRLPNSSQVSPVTRSSSAKTFQAMRKKLQSTRES